MRRISLKISWEIYPKNVSVKNIMLLDLLSKHKPYPHFYNVNVVIISLLLETYERPLPFGLKVYIL